MLDDLFEHSRHKRHSAHRHDDERQSGYGYERHGHHQSLLDLAQRVVRNKALLTGLALTFLFIGALGIWLVVTLLPYFLQLLSTAGGILEQQGIKGILEDITPLLQRLWEGSGK
jgi:hypothetical protein